jgi:phage gpG-like protein
MRFELEVHGDQLISRRLLRIADRLIDFTPAFIKIADDIRASEQQLFDTEGASAGRPWQALRQHTIDAKVRQGQDPRILHRDGALEQSLTKGHGGTPADNQILIITPSALAMGSSLPYAGAHQRGTGSLPQRRPMDFAEHTKQQLIKRLQAHAMERDR